MSVNSKMTAIADEIRSKTARTEFLTLDDMVASITDVYEAGQNAEHNEFWDEYQQNGNRVNYACAFGGLGWDDAMFKPKYDMCPTDAYMMFRSSTITDLSNLNVVLDFSKVTNMQYMFQWAQVRHIGVFDMTSMTTLTTSTFAYAYLLHTIDKIIVTEKIVFNSCFDNCTKLANITFEGIIGNSINFKDSPLTKKSITSVINALSSSATGKTVTFNKTAKEAAFTADEWETLIQTKPNWEIKLV